MKLYLLSYKLGNHTDELKKWLENSKNNRIAKIANSSDMFPDGEIKINGIQSDAKDLEELGFKVKLLDLKTILDRKKL